MKRFIFSLMTDDEKYLTIKDKQGNITGKRLRKTYPISNKSKDYELIEGEEVYKYLDPNSEYSIWRYYEKTGEELIAMFIGSTLYKYVKQLHDERKVYIGLRNFNITDLCEHLRYYTISGVRCVFAYDNTVRHYGRFEYFIGSDIESPYLPIPKIEIKTTLSEILDSLQTFWNDDSECIGFDYETTNLPEWTDFKIIGFGLATEKQTHYIDLRKLTKSEFDIYNQYFKEFCKNNYKRMWVYNVNFEQIATYREIGEWCNFQDLMVYIKVLNLGYSTLKKFVPLLLTHVKSWDDELDFLFEKLEGYFKTYKTIGQLKASGIDIDPRIELNEDWYSDNLFGLIDAKTMGYYCGLDSYWTMLAYKALKNQTEDTFDRAYNAIKTNYYLASSIYASGIKLNETLRRKYEDTYTTINMNCDLIVSYAYYKKLLIELDKLIEGKTILGFPELCTELLSGDYTQYTINFLSQYLIGGKTYKKRVFELENDKEIDSKIKTLKSSDSFNIKKCRSENDWISLDILSELETITNRNIKRKTKIIDYFSNHFKEKFENKVTEYKVELTKLLDEQYFYKIFNQAYQDFFKENYKNIIKGEYPYFSDNPKELRELYRNYINLKKSCIDDDNLKLILNKEEVKTHPNPLLAYFQNSYGLLATLKISNYSSYVFYDTIKFRDSIKAKLEDLEMMSNFNLLDTKFKINKHPLNQGNDVDNKEYYITMTAGHTKYAPMFLMETLDNTKFQPKSTKRLEDYEYFDVKKANNPDDLLDIFSVASILKGDSEKQLSTYLKGFIYSQSKMFTKFDNNNMTTWDKPEYSDDYLVIKPKINVCGVTTKRSSSGFHTTPPECDFMTIFEPENDDRWFVYSDASAAEVKTVIFMSGDEGMIEAVNSGEDMYNTIGKLIEGDSYDVKNRGRYKVILLGKIYGLGDETAAKRLNVPVELIQEMNRKIAERAPKFWNYIQSKIEFCNQNRGLCQTILGDILEVRDINKTHTQGINYVVQGGTSIMLGDGFYNIWYQNFKRGLEPSAKAWIHDSITLTIPIKYTHHYYLAFDVDYSDYLYNKYGIRFSQSPKYKFNMRDEMPLKIDKTTGICTLEGYKHDIDKYIQKMSITPEHIEKTTDSEYIFQKEIKRGRYEMYINNNFNSYEKYKLTYKLDLDYLKEIEDNLRNNIFEY